MTGCSRPIYEIVTIQRDYGNRSDRKLARLKYTVDKYGVDWYRQELAKRTGFGLEAARPMNLPTEHYYGWQQIIRAFGTIPLLSRTAGSSTTKSPAQIGLARDRPNRKGQFPLYRQPEPHPRRYPAKGQDRSSTDPEKFKVIRHTEAASAIRKNSIACVALPTCGLALAEAQRYLPDADQPYRTPAGQIRPG
jgi:sulfite reductase (NADPH) hemoprotein beta-component